MSEEKFPYEEFPIRLEHYDEKKGKMKKSPMKICYFQHIDDANKYIKKYNLKKNQYFLEERT
jgi:hypothetical protein